jgi:hypothetical protein
MRRHRKADRRTTFEIESGTGLKMNSHEDEESKYSVEE